MKIAFAVLSFFLVLTAIGVVTFRNPIHSALCLIANLIGVAGVFAWLDAHFLAVVQIIVYAGAIMVLVVFVIMLLNMKVEEARPSRLMLLALSSAAGVLLVCILAVLFFEDFGGIPDVDSLTLFATSTGSNPEGTVRAIGELLYTKYAFPFEAASLLIMASIVGAVMLAKQTHQSGKEGV